MRYFEKVTVVQHKLGQPDIVREIKFNRNTGFAIFTTFDKLYNIGICETETLGSEKAISFIAFPNYDVLYENTAGMTVIKEDSHNVQRFEHFDILVEFNGTLSRDKSFRFTYASK